MGWAGLLPGTFYPLILNLLKDGLGRIAAGIVYPLILNLLKDGLARPGFRRDLTVIPA